MLNKDTFFLKKLSINCNGRLISLKQPKVMGVINITPDSFYDGGRYNTIEKILGQVEKDITEGADIIDIGAYSSRPGAKYIQEKEELKRLRPALEAIRKKFPDIVLSVDTFRHEIAKRLIRDYRVDIINDISSGGLDDKMFETIAEFNVPYIIMHMKGTPENMQENPTYKDLLNELITYFINKTDKLRSLGVFDIIIDPGFGFGKSIDHNYEILAKLNDLKILQLPLLVGLSRKSMIYKHLSITPAEALNGTTVLNTVALLSGADILRVHDVKEAKEAVKLVYKIMEFNSNY